MDILNLHKICRICMKEYNNLKNINETEVNCQGHTYSLFHVLNAFLDKV